MKALSKSDMFIIRAVVGYAVLACTWIFFSDSLLAKISDRASLANVSTYKGIFFVAVTTLLLYFALNQAANRNIAASSPEHKASWLKFAAIGTALFSFTAMALGIYHAEIDAQRRAVLSQVQAVADIKADAISRRLEEQRRDVAVFCDDWTHRAELSRWKAEGSAYDPQRLEDLLRLAATAHDVAAVSLVGPGGARLAGDPAAGSDSPEFIAAVKRAAGG